MKAINSETWKTGRKLEERGINGNLGHSKMRSLMREWKGSGRDLVEMAGNVGGGEGGLVGAFLSGHT